MKFKKTKIAALTLASVLACGSLAGCALVTTDSNRDLLQTVAEVNISKSADFAAGGKYAEYAKVIPTGEVLKRELIASYASNGSSYVSYFGWSAEQTYNYLMNNLVNRQIYLQYAYVYFFENGADLLDKDGNVVGHRDFTVADFNEAVSASQEKDKSIAGIRYFLEQDEIDATEYTLKVNINGTLDSQEHEVIEGNHSHDHDDSTSATSSRKTPTGVDTKNEDYYDTNYKIYTGMGNPDANAGYSANPSNCGTYEAQDESTPASRKKAYKNFIASLSTYGLVNKGENTSDITSLTYYNLERKNQYQSALLTKLSKAFENNAANDIKPEWLEKRFNDTLEVQRATFSNSDNTELTSALDAASDSNFVLYAPTSEEGYGYGYVINILLPFSAAQTQELNDSPADLGDLKGNKFAKRASLLQNLKATDQRGAWIAADYAYEADDAFGGEGRNYLFFENNRTKSDNAEGIVAQYKKIPNYLGQYSYNGSVYKNEDDEYSYNPTKIDIDGFLDEMEKYLDFAGLHLTDKFEAGKDYYTQKDFYNEKGEVDYSNFLYYSASIEELGEFNANDIFKRGSLENKAMSVINELSFAYNTDTAGLNSYLGYSVSPNNTNFVKEFEFAAQLAVKMGAGSITVAPSDYGWHIMYCTLSYAKDSEPFSFNPDDITVEGTFSNLYYEAMKADNFSNYSSDREREILNSFNNDACVTIYTERYADRYAA